MLGDDGGGRGDGGHGGGGVTVTGISGRGSMSIGGGGSMSVGGGGSMSVADSLDDGGGVDIGVGAVDNGGTLADVHDGLTGDSDGVGDGVRLVNMDSDGHLTDLLLDDGDIIGDMDLPLNVDGLVDNVGLLHGLDKGSVLLDGSAEDGRDLDGEHGGGRLDDVDGLARDELGLAEMELLGDNGGLLMDGGGGGSLLNGGVRSGHMSGHGGRVGVSHRGSGHGYGGSGVVSGGGARSGKHGGQNNQGVHDAFRVSPNCVANATKDCD